MNTTLEKIVKLASKTIPFDSTKIFTYPTRLASAWRAEIREINLPPGEINRPKIEINARQDSTRSLDIKTRNIYKQIYKRFAAPLHMDEEYIFDSRFETDKNMAHILQNIASALLAAKKICPEITVILRANASTMAKNAYKLLGFPLLCTDKEVHGKLILAPSGSHGDYEGWYSSLFNNIVYEEVHEQAPERIFISRKGARCLINENQVEQTLKEYGFEKFYYEDIAINKQWLLSKNAKAIVAIHGAALSSLVFNRNAVKVVELFHPGYVTHTYRNMTYAVGGKWCGVTGQINQDVIKKLDFKKKARSFAASPTQIDITSLCMALQHLDIG